MGSVVSLGELRHGRLFVEELLFWLGVGGESGAQETAAGSAPLPENARKDKRKMSVYQRFRKNRAKDRCLSASGPWGLRPRGKPPHAFPGLAPSRGFPLLNPMNWRPGKSLKKRHHLSAEETVCGAGIHV